MEYIEYSDHPGIFSEHAFPEHIVDLGEIRMNYAVVGEPANPALLLIPGQTESWWGYEAAMHLLAEKYQVYAVDLRGQGRSTWTPGRYSLDLFGNDLVRFIERVIGRPVVVSGLSSGGVLAAWLSAFAAPGQIRAAVLEDPPLFASETAPAVGPSIRQGIAGPMFQLMHKWLGPQWSIGDEDGFRAAIGRETPGWVIGAFAAASAARDGELPPRQETDLHEYDPEWGDAFYSGRVGLTCDHEAMLSHVKVPVLFTHHFHFTDPETGNLIGAISDQQAQHARRLIEGAGNSFTYRAFPAMPHSLHAHDPATYVATVTEWLDGLDAAPQVKATAPEVKAATVEVTAPKPGEAVPATGKPAETTADGTWSITIQAPGGPQETTLTLAAQGGILTGTLNDAALEDGRVDGSAISFKAHLTSPVKVKITCSATIDGDTMTGQAKARLLPLAIPFTGVRTASTAR
jgi:pimeloyl-ACP methyl ester carboxylesterase